MRANQASEPAAAAWPSPRSLRRPSLTASHVVGRSEAVTLRLYDGTSISGTVVAVDKSIDTAVIRAEEGAAADLKPFVLGPLADVQVGEMTIAIGEPVRPEPDGDHRKS